MDSIEKRVARYVKDKGINLSKLARDTGIPYVSVYSSLFDETRERPLRVSEYFAICDFLGKDPMDFADRKEANDG